MGLLGLYWGYLGFRVKGLGLYLTTASEYWGHIAIIVDKIETTTVILRAFGQRCQDLGFHANGFLTEHEVNILGVLRVWGLGFRA